MNDSLLVLEELEVARESVSELLAFDGNDLSSLEGSALDKLLLCNDLDGFLGNSAFGVDLNAFWFVLANNSAFQELTAANSGLASLFA